MSSFNLFSLDCHKYASKRWPKIHSQYDNYLIQRNQTNHENKRNSLD